MDWIKNKVPSPLFCKTRRNLIFSVGRIAWIARNSTFFGFIGGQEGEHRGRFDATGLREECNDHALNPPVCAREKTIIFSLFPSARGRKRSFFESSHLRKGDEEEVYWRAEDTLWRRSDFSVFFNTIRYKKGKENLLK